MFKASLASVLGVLLGLAVAASAAEPSPEGDTERPCCKLPKSD